MSDTQPEAQLTSLRQSIDNIDAALVHLLAERFKFTQQVGRLKAATPSLPVFSSSALMATGNCPP